MKNLKTLLFAALLFALAGSTNAQSVGVNSDGSAPNGSAMLDVSSSTKGFLPPRMTKAQRDAISNPTPATGLLIFQTDNVPGYYYYNGTSWIDISSRATGLNAGDMQYWNGSAWIKIPAGSPGQFLQFSASNMPAWAGVGFPEVTTTAATSIGNYTVTSGGNVTNDGGESEIVRGVCWSTSTNPTISNNKTIDGTGAGVYTSLVTGLSPTTKFYLRAYATNGSGTTYGNETSFTTELVNIGDSYGGGIVAYKLQSGDPGYSEFATHGLIAATLDQSYSASWHNGTNTTTGATATAIGAGSANTTTIIDNQGNTGSYAAKLCRDYRGGGFSDWFLPSENELSKLYALKLAGFGNLANSWYWSSTESWNPDGARMLLFSTGQWSFYQKYYADHVRAMRYF